MTSILTKSNIQNVDPKPDPELVALKCQVKQIQDDMKKQFNKLQAEYDHLQGKYDQLQRKCDQLQRKCDQLQRKCDHLESSWTRDLEEVVSSVLCSMLDTIESASINKKKKSVFYHVADAKRKKLSEVNVK